MKVSINECHYTKPDAVQAYMYMYYIDMDLHTIEGVVADIQCLEHDKAGKRTQLHNAVHTDII